MKVLLVVLALAMSMSCNRSKSIRSDESTNTSDLVGFWMGKFFDESSETRNIYNQPIYIIERKSDFSYRCRLFRINNEKKLFFEEGQEVRGFYKYKNGVLTEQASGSEEKITYKVVEKNGELILRPEAERGGYYVEKRISSYNLKLPDKHEEVTQEEFESW